MHWTLPWGAQGAQAAKLPYDDVNHTNTISLLYHGTKEAFAALPFPRLLPGCTSALAMRRVPEKAGLPYITNLDTEDLVATVLPIIPGSHSRHQLH